MTTTFRERIEGMTPGKWSAREIHDNGDHFHMVRAVYHDHAGRRTTAYPATCECGGQPNEANATGIVLSVATARLVASDELPRNMARVMLNLQEGPATAERMEREETIQWRNRLRDAKAVLSAIQAAAMERK